MIDATLFAVLARRFDTIAATMQHTLVRASRSGVIANGHDCSCCVITNDHRLLSAAQSIPIHVMSGADRMSQTLAELHPALRRGDAFLHNSPYHGCTHAADLSVLVPVIDEHGTHHYTVLAKAHQADIGNSKPTTYMADAIDLYEEGALLFPATQIQSDYAMQEDIVRMARLRIRAPDQWHGDLLALIGAARTGEKGLLALGAEFGWETLHTFAEDWFSYSEQTMRDAIRLLPGGSATASSTHDAFPGTQPEGVTVSVTVEVIPEEGRMVIDLRDNEDCLPCGLNLSEASARSSALIGAFNSLGQDLPANAASVACIDVLLRENCVVGIPTPTTSCSVATTNLADRVANAVQHAVASISERYGAAESGAIEGPVGAVISGTQPHGQRQHYINQLALAGTAGGASSRGDGWLTLGNTCTAGMWTMDSIEIDELNYPLLVSKRGLITDSEGCGQFCGAPSCQVIYEPLDAPMKLHYACDGVDHPAKGARGGGDGAPARQWLRRRDGEVESLPGLGEITLHPGERVIANSSAGGGFGDPAKREIKKVSAAVEAGLVSVTRALQVYAVVCDSRGEVDHASTESLRQRR